MILLLAAAALADAPPQDERTAVGIAQLQEGRPLDAVATFRGILSGDPTRLDARDGLVRALLAAGLPEEAAAEADARLKLRPDDVGWQRWRLYVLGVAPSRREDAIAGLREFLVAHPDDFESACNLALFLSWTSGRLEEAIPAWRHAVDLRPTNDTARLGLARTLAWAGHDREAITRYDALLAEHPDDPEALIGRAQVARWAGDRSTARLHVEHAVEVAPMDPRVLAEQARLELDSGRIGLARTYTRQAEALSPGLYEAGEADAAIRRAIAPRVALRATATTESTGFVRFGAAIPVDLHLLPDTRLRVEPSYEQVAGKDRLNATIDVRQTGLPSGLYLRGAYTFHALLDGVQTHAVDLEVGATHALDLPLDFRIGARRRALVDLPLPDDPIAPLEVVGSGGATEAGLVEGLQVGEAYGGLVVAPFKGAYVYADGAYGAVDGGDTRGSLAAGVGVDIVRLLADRPRFGVTPHYDLYVLGVATPDDRFFSPQKFIVQTPGIEARWSSGPVTVGAEGGLPLRADVAPGWLVGAFGAVDLGEHVRIGARFKLLDDTAWRATGGTLLVSGRW